MEKPNPMAEMAFEMYATKLMVEGIAAWLLRREPDKEKAIREMFDDITIGLDALQVLIEENEGLTGTERWPAFREKLQAHLAGAHLRTRQRLGLTPE